MFYFYILCTLFISLLLVVWLYLLFFDKFIVFVLFFVVLKNANDNDELYYYSPLYGEIDIDLYYYLDSFFNFIFLLLLPGELLLSVDK